MLSAVLFDLDGTIADTSRDITTNINRALADHHFQTLDHAVILGHLGYGAKTLLERCMLESRTGEQFSDDLMVAVLNSFRDHYLNNLVVHTRLYPQVTDFLDLLDVPLGVISNKPEQFVQGVLLELGLLGRFQFAWGKDSTDHPKPDPGVILEGLTVLDLPVDESVWFIGDSPVDIRAARAAGVTAIGLTRGYTPIEKLESEGAHLLVDGYAELIRYFHKIAS